jgi:hypothetical protein
MIYDIIKKLKKNRAPGEDGISAELLKQGGIVLSGGGYIKSLSRCGKRKKWQLICPVYKKGDKLNCSNYRGISLLNVVYKIFTNTLARYLEVYTE